MRSHRGGAVYGRPDGVEDGALVGHSSWRDATGPVPTARRLATPRPSRQGDLVKPFVVFEDLAASTPRRTPRTTGTPSPEERFATHTSRPSTTPDDRTSCRPTHASSSPGTAPPGPGSTRRAAARPRGTCTGPTGGGWGRSSCPPASFSARSPRSAWWASGGTRSAWSTCGRTGGGGSSSDAARAGRLSHHPSSSHARSAFARMAVATKAASPSARFS